ncbi:molybdopterin molybdenumtransferase MoeA [archaeon SCG-AAA382B04]|nr:molybdopterin molybdenumtransferase MoeA [archaeon SCG-AAA382B04]
MKKKNGFRELEKFNEARKKFVESIEPLEKESLLKIVNADDGVLSSSIISPKSIPSFNKSAMDGYAVKASDTYGASESSPIFLDLKKDVGEEGAERVHTGSAIPKDSDSVVKIEDVEKDNNRLEVFKALSPGENVDFVGEDVEEGEIVFEKNHHLRPFDIGLLRSLGIEKINVYKKPKVLVIPTGNEVVSKGEEPRQGEVIESNSLVIQLMCEKYGADVDKHEIVEDDPKKILESLQKVDDYDMIIYSGGTSVGSRDHTAEVIEETGTVFSHGIGMKPAKPTLLGEYKETPIICLPGHPVACSISCFLFAKPSLFKLSNRTFSKSKKESMLERKVESTVGYKTFTRVRLVDDRAIPIRTSGAGIQTSLTSADGLVIIPEEKEGLAKGKKVEVVLFD